MRDHLSFETTFSQTVSFIHYIYANEPLTKDCSSLKAVVSFTFRAVLKGGFYWLSGYPASMLAVWLSH